MVPLTVEHQDESEDDPDQRLDESTRVTGWQRSREDTAGTRRTHSAGGGDATLDGSSDSPVRRDGGMFDQTEARAAGIGGCVTAVLRTETAWNLDFDIR
jgi:hypothetical protein